MIVKNQFFTILVVTFLLLFIENSEAGWKFWKTETTTTTTTIVPTSVNIQPTATTTTATTVRGSTKPAVNTGAAVTGATNPGTVQINARPNRPNPGTEVGLDIAVPRPNTPKIGNRNDQNYRNWAIEFAGAGEPSRNPSPRLPAQGQVTNNDDQTQRNNRPEIKSTSTPSIQPTPPSTADSRLRNTPQPPYQSTSTGPAASINQNKPDTPSALNNPGRTWADVAASGSRPLSPTDSPRQPEYSRHPISDDNEHRTTHTRPLRPGQIQPSQFSRAGSPGATTVADVTIAGATTEAAGAANRALDSYGKTYSSNPTYSKGNTVTDEDLEKLSEALYIKEANPNRYITINVQKQTTSSSPTDEAPQPLLRVSSEASQIPTIQRVLSIFDNYQLDTRTNEYISPSQRQEESLLVDTFLSTNVMSAAMRFLADKGFVRKDYYEYKDTLRKIWFDLFSRGQGKIGSSGFEHVFMAETKQTDSANTEVLGLHNWIYFNAEESKNHADYLGYIKKVDIGNKGSIIKLHAKFNGHDKPVTTMFIGTSPELEMALYTVCFHVRPDGNCPVSLGGTKFNIVTRKFKYRGKDLIGTAYPEI